MPRYLLRTDIASDACAAAAVHLAGECFPGIKVERREVISAGADAHMHWVCRAPSEAHLHRWATAAQLGVGSVRQVEQAPPKVTPVRARRSTTDQPKGHLPDGGCSAPGIQRSLGT
jgi:hypothetical protein